MIDNQMNRCSLCILPINFPGVFFNGEGVCNFCIEGIGVPNMKPGLSSTILGAKTIIVALSGGRDSCFGLHYLKEKTSAELIAFTYDWPLVNSRARRNASRIVSQLGVEHVLRAPKSFDQLKYIRRIIYAIRKQPDPRLVPMLLAPDKFFFSSAQEVSKRYKADAIVFCAGNELEFTSFKSQVSGAKSTKPNEMLQLGKFQALKLLVATGMCYFRNPRLFLAGVKLPLNAYLQTYFSRPRIEYLFQQIEWNESEIEEVLSNYCWEGPGSARKEFKWRSGDGTSDFYNYLYYQMLGFNEKTTNLASRVRAGLLTRNEALRLEQENSTPDLDALRTYASTVGFQLDEFLREFNDRVELKYRKNRN